MQARPEGIKIWRGLERCWRVYVCDTLWISLAKKKGKKNPSHRCLEAEEEEQQGRARSLCASFSDKSRRDFKRHFSAICNLICVQNAPTTDEGSVGAAWGARREPVPRNGDKVPKNEDKMVWRLCPMGWRCAGAAHLTVPGQRRPGREYHDVADGEGFTTVVVRLQ